MKGNDNYKAMCAYIRVLLRMTDSDRAWGVTYGDVAEFCRHIDTHKIIKEMRGQGLL